MQTPSQKLEAWAKEHGFAPSLHEIINEMRTVETACEAAMQKDLEVKNEKEFLLIKRLPSNDIQLEAYGEAGLIAGLVFDAMVGNLDTACAVCAAIPAFLDRIGKTRESYCETVMSAHGLKGEINEQK